MTETALGPQFAPLKSLPRKYLLCDNGIVSSRGGLSLHSHACSKQNNGYQLDFDSVRGQNVPMQGQIHYIVKAAFVKQTWWICSYGPLVIPGPAVFTLTSINEYLDMVAWI